MPGNWVYTGIKSRERSCAHEDTESGTLGVHTDPNALDHQVWTKETKRLIAEHGDRLVCVRYRYDAQKKRRYKTVELIVEEMPWTPKPKRPRGDSIAAIRVNWGEADVARQVKRAGGKWNPQKKVWELRYDQVVQLGLQSRLVPGGSI
ncbi:hypothetical protein ANRL1_02260 [Anaerolineae bacterium]|nr:hypothetical protein ANRL1_02260 [Anaerolineae bacterium]